MSVVALAACGLAWGCAAEADPAADEGENDVSEGAVVPITEPDETAPVSALAPQPLDTSATELIDIRGVGDSGWSKTHEATPIEAEFGAALDRFDRTGHGVRGDLSFINWETVVGSRCTQFGSAYRAGASYAFVSRPENLDQAYARGFNLVALSNNHTRDCHGSPEASSTGEVASVEMTAGAMARVDAGKDWLWSGIGDDAADVRRARVRTFQIKGRAVKVAFASAYTGRATCPRAACMNDVRAVMTSLRDADADVRILAMHSRASDDQDQLARLGVEFVRDFNGDVVFGHGPHKWKPVRVVRKGAQFGGGTGVVFESLGNFLHPALGAQSRNFIGRALLDAHTLKLAQVQLIPVANAGTEIRWSTTSAAEVDSNLRWSRTERGVFANVKP